MLGTVVCDALMRHCLSDEFEVQHECKLQCPHTFITQRLSIKQFAVQRFLHSMRGIYFLHGGLHTHIDMLKKTKLELALHSERRDGGVLPRQREGADAAPAVARAGTVSQRRA